MDSSLTESDVLNLMIYNEQGIHMSCLHLTP